MGLRSFPPADFGFMLAQWASKPTYSGFLRVHARAAQNNEISDEGFASYDSFAGIVLISRIAPKKVEVIAIDLKLQPRMHRRLVQRRTGRQVYFGSAEDAIFELDDLINYGILPTCWCWDPAPPVDNGWIPRRLTSTLRLFKIRIYDWAGPIGDWTVKAGPEGAWAFCGDDVKVFFPTAEAAMRRCQEVERLMCAKRCQAMAFRQ